MSTNKLKVIACIPAYNEETNIAKVIIKAQKYVDMVIVCDDGSTDMTADIAEKLGAEVIKHERNMGYGAALASLFRRAYEIDPDIMITLDGDGQHNPDDIPRFIESMIKENADIIIGSRFLKKEDVPKIRKIGINVITKLVKISSYREITDAQSGFRAYNKKALQQIMPTEQGMGASTEILIRAKEKGLKIKEIPIRVNYQVKEPSTHNPLYHGIDVVLSTIKHLSMRHPLLIYGIPGFITLIIAMIFWILLIGIFTDTRQIVTNIALIAIGATIIGLILLTIAVLLWILLSVIREMKYQR